MADSRLTRRRSGTSGIQSVANPHPKNNLSREGKTKRASATMIPIHILPKRFPSSLKRYKRAGFVTGGGVLTDVSLWATTSSRAFSALSDTTSTAPSTAAQRHAVGHFSSMAKQQVNFTPRVESVRVGGSSGLGDKSKQHAQLTRTPPHATVTAPAHTLKLQEFNLFGNRSSEWWTGKQPIIGMCPGVRDNGTICSLPQLSLASDTCSRETLQAYFDNTWAMTEVLFSSLQGEEAFMSPPYHDLRHPLIFYYGHPACLYVNKLRVGGLLASPINPYFESIFETGVDEMSWDDLSKNKMPWPSVSEVHHYRKQVYAKVSEVISNLTDDQCIDAGPSSPIWALAMSFEHERIHLETSSVLINELPQKYVQFPKHFPGYHPSIPGPNDATQNPIASVHYPANELLSVKGKTISIGKPKDYPSFGWDNEYGFREFQVPAFAASKYKISNGEFLEFVRDGGYSKRDLWSDDGWEWRAFRNAKWPSFWVRSGPQGLHHFELRVIFDTVPMPWSWPVSVNYHEAHAYAAWYAKKHGKNIRVMTELEHKAIRDPTETDSKGRAIDPVMKQLGAEQQQDSGNNTKATTKMMSMVEALGVNTNLSHGSMNPVDSFKPNLQGFYDVFGNAWEWTTDYFCALPGFEVHPFYEDFSTPCFDGLHNVIQGGSFISSGNESSHFSRFHFRPHFFQHASFRIVEQLSPNLITSDTDAPGPFVGSYPYRRSDAGMKSAILNNAKDGNTKSHSIEYEKLKHFGSLERLHQSLTLHHSSPLPSIHVISSIVLEGAQNIGINLAKARAIDVGCSAGAIAFDLATKVQSVIGIDHHLENIKLAKALQSNINSKNGKNMVDEKDIYTVARAEGDLVEKNRIAPLAPLPATQLEFRMADPMCLPAEMLGFDIVVVNDVLDKISSPNSLLGRLCGVRGLVRSNGLLAITSSFMWNSDITPKSLWLGGYTGPDGIQVSSLATLTDRLKNDFDLVSEINQPVLWQETCSEFKCKFLSVSLWKRK